MPVSVLNFTSILAIFAFACISICPHLLVLIQSIFHS